MSKARESLKAVLLAKGLSPESDAESFVNSLSELDAKKMLEALMSVSGGPSENLPSGEGGLIAGLRKILDSRKFDAEFTLPSDPHNLSRAEKEKIISEMEANLKKSDDAFVDGLRILLASKSSERLDTLKNWVKELSDEDFPFAIKGLEKEFTRKSKNMANTVGKKMEESSKNITNLARKHKDISDDS